MAPAASDKRIALAAVAGAHGVKGEVRLKLFGDSVDSLARQESVFAGGIERRLLFARSAGKGAVARFEGVDDRTAAEALRGTLIEVDRVALPPLEDGEYYHADLIGLEAFDASGKSLGYVVAVENYGAGDILEIAPPKRPSILVPFTKASVPDIDVVAGRLVVMPPTEIEVKPSEEEQ